MNSLLELETWLRKELQRKELQRIELTDASEDEYSQGFQQGRIDALQHVLEHVGDMETEYIIGSIEEFSKHRRITH